MKAALLIDGGHLRAVAGKAGITYTNDFIEQFAHGCLDVGQGEILLRALYYDCPQFRGTRQLPVSGASHNFLANDGWMDDLAGRDYFAVRRGNLAWRGWALRKQPPVGTVVTDADFKPVFEQKGVDMRIGLDIATISAERSVERIILVSADTDMIPAMKHARKSGLQVVGIQLPAPAIKLTKAYMAHIDFYRPVAWPAKFTPVPAAPAGAPPSNP